MTKSRLYVIEGGLDPAEKLAKVIPLQRQGLPQEDIADNLGSMPSETGSLLTKAYFGTLHTVERLDHRIADFAHWLVEVIDGKL